MEIREAKESDIGEIIKLLKSSLGESLMPKSEAYWRWKHVENPFGVSPALLCWDKDVLIGVRAFMRWKWRNHERTYRALRAVDTATHPDYQGKGIFKKLTLSLIDLCNKDGDDLIFNTPNQQSKPGYLKMGWVEAGKLPLRMSLERPFNLIRNLISAKPHTDIEKESASLEYYLKHPKLVALLDTHYSRMKTISTLGSPAYLIWRYMQVPVAHYIAIGEETGEELTGLILGRIKPTRFGRELRITDFFWNGNSNGKELKMKVMEIKKSREVDYITITGTAESQSINLLSSLNFSAAIGPMVTLRSLQLASLDSFSNFNNWSPSLGDLELF